MKSGRAKTKKKFNAGKATAAAAAVVVVFYLLAARGLRKAETFHVGWLAGRRTVGNDSLSVKHGRREGKRGKSVIFRGKTKESSICVFHLKTHTHLPDI